MPSHCALDGQPLLQEKHQGHGYAQLRLYAANNQAYRRSRQHHIITLNAQNKVSLHTLIRIRGDYPNTLLTQLTKGFSYKRVPRACTTTLIAECSRLIGFGWIRGFLPYMNANTILTHTFKQCSHCCLHGDCALVIISAACKN